MRRLSLLLPILFIIASCELDTTQKSDSYTITYYGNENTSGNVPIDTNTYKLRSNATILDKNTLHKDGYSFKWWNTNLNNTGSSYYPGTIISVNNNISLYAIWQDIVMYTVTFNSNGGDQVQSITELLDGSKIVMPDTPIKLGYLFKAWYKDEQLTQIWDFDTDTITSSITLYAKWEKEIYPYEVSGISHYKVGNTVVVTWTNPSDSNFYCVRIIPAGYESMESELLNRKPNENTYTVNDYANTEYIIIKTVNNDKIVSEGLRYYLVDNTPPVTVYDLVPSVNVVKVYASNIIDPADIYCSVMSTTGSNPSVINNDKYLLYITSENPVEDFYIGYVHIKSSWTWIEFRVYDDSAFTILLDHERIPILHD